MTSNEIVALRCPSCGEGITQPSREMPFGAEFRCDGCDITSVLIVNRDLVPLSTLQKLGEKVCVTCGRFARREARFCQEGHPLSRNCVNCRGEIEVNGQRCDLCGWPQNMKPGTIEAVALEKSLAFDRAVSDVNDRSIMPRHDDALKVIIADGGTASETAKTTAVSAILSLMEDPFFLQRSNVYEGRNYTEKYCWQALGALGPASRQAAPLLRQRIEKLSWVGNGMPDELSVLVAISPADAIPILRKRIENNWCRGWRHPSYKVVGWRDVSYWVSVLGTISPQDALEYCRRSLDEGGKNDGGPNERGVRGNIEGAIQTAFSLGNIAIPVLESFCGTFSGRRGKACTAAITALRNGQKSVDLSAL